MGQSTTLPQKQITFHVKGQKGAIPAIGLGTVGLNEKCTDSCAAALAIGYRHLDAALSYGNHQDVGEAIRQSGVPREEIFVSTKIVFCPYIADQNEAEATWLYDAVNTKGNEAACIDLCLEQLGLDYVDLLLVHNPTVSREEYGAACLPHFFELFQHKQSPSAIRPDILPDGSRLRSVLRKAKMDELVRTVDKEGALSIRKKTWAAMEKALSDGKCKFIGVSNYPAALLEEMKTYATIMPAVNQVELTPWFARQRLRDTASRLGIAIVAYGSGQTMSIRKDETVQEIAEKYDKSPMQVILRWNLQGGIASIPNSGSPDHIRENYSVLDDFELSDEDMNRLNDLEENYPLYWDPMPTIATIKDRDDHEEYCNYRMYNCQSWQDR
mmetsp:Transcript_22430/g.48632  ORF Transcript_22430/g.48632 Transcript_22430/m.48632 type:complete len:383 (+) Transcript_22430:175-1323(+)